MHADQSLHQDTAAAPDGHTAVALPHLRVCPECAGPLARGSGCLHCLSCGWGRCG